MAEVITQIQQPPEFIEAAAKPYITELQQAVGGFKGADLSKVYGPQFVAGMDPTTKSYSIRGSYWRLSQQVLKVLDQHQQDFLANSCSKNRSKCLSRIYVSISKRCYSNNFTRF